MRNEDLHISDQELLLSADGELSSRRSEAVHAHLASCWDCRARMEEMETAIITFARAYRQTLSPQLSSDAGPRALLQARLGELASQYNAGSRHWFPLFSLPPGAVAIWTALLVVVLAGAAFFHHQAIQGRFEGTAMISRGAVPNPRLTPGRTRSITVSDACLMPHEEVVAEVPTSLRQQVLREYGIANARSGDYEIDYLIAPGLGGVEDIHNLWPEPYRSHIWNAYVKDALEERLHQMVCTRELDLHTAQRDIATNWVAAYKKYFHTKRPVSSAHPSGQYASSGFLLFP